MFNIFMLIQIVDVFVYASYLYAFELEVEETKLISQYC